MINIMDVFDTKADLNPNKNAIFSENKVLTYGELQRLSNSLAKILIEDYRINKNTIIPILFTPGIELIISIFAILKSGCSYLPLSPTNPKDRIDLYLNIIKSNILITNTEYSNININIINSNQFLSQAQTQAFEHENIQGELSYILYTSGSTGQPKGVTVTPKNLSYILENMQNYYPCMENDRYLLGTPYTFDVSVTEIFGWILGGSALVVTDFEAKNSLRNIVGIVEKHKVTHMALSPSVLKLLLNMITNEERYSLDFNLKFLMIAGEEFPTKLVNKALNLLPHVTISNLYGPTECSVYATHYIFNNDKEYKRIPIGSELDNCQCFVIDEEEGILKDDEVGELCISGEGVTLGYLNDEKQSAEKFVELKTESIGSIRIYKTGDLVSKDSNGIFFYHGRKDNQIQINGIRVEIGEIESNIESHQEILESVVLYENKCIYCFYTSSTNLSDAQMTEVLHHQATSTMPRYMRPNIYIKLDKLPINQNGKVDRKYLNISYVKENVINEILNEKLTDTESKVKSIFISVGVELESTQDDFFISGGNSLSAIEAVDILEKHFNISIDDDYIYSFSSLESIALDIDYKIKEKSNSNACSILSDNFIEKYKPDIKTTFIENNNLIINNSNEKKHQTLAHQKVFINVGFTSCLCTTLDINRSRISSTDLQVKIRNFTSYLPLLNTYLKYDELNSLCMFEIVDFRKIKIPVFNVSNQNSTEISAIVDSLRVEYENCLSVNHLRSILSLILIIEVNNVFKVVFLIDHTIADKAALHILKRLFSNFLEYKKYPIEPTYHDYIKMVEQKNSSFEFIKKHVENIDKIVNKDVFNKKILGLKDGLFIFKKKLCSRLSNDDLSALNNYIVGHLSCDYFSTSKAVIRIIVNNRDYYDDFNNVFGACHGYTFFIHNDDITYDQYKSYFKDFINYYHNKKHVDFNYLVNKNCPSYTLEEAKYKDILFEKVPVSSNMIGTIREVDFHNYVNSMHKKREKLKVYKENMLRTTSFVCGDSLYVCFLNQFDLNENILHELGLNYINTDSIPYFFPKKNNNTELV